MSAITDIADAMADGRDTHAKILAKDYLVDFMIGRTQRSFLGDTIPVDHWDAAISDLEVELISVLSVDDDVMEAVGRQVSSFISELVAARDFILEAADDEYAQTNDFAVKRAYNRSQHGGLR